MQKTLFNQALLTIRGELARTSEGLALLTDDRLIALEAARDRSLPLTVGTCAVLAGYPRFSTRTRKLQSLAVVGCGFSIQRSPGGLLIAGRIFATDDKQVIIQISPRLMPAFFVPCAGTLPNAKEGEYWRLQCLLKGGLATLIDGEKLRSAYTPPVLKRKKHNRPSKRQQIAA